MIVSTIRRHHILYRTRAKRIEKERERFAETKNLGNEKELEKADAWLEEKGLNRYGDEEGMMYMGGSPLFNETTGVQKDRLEYLLEKNPNKPWATGRSVSDPNIIMNSE